MSGYSDAFEPFGKEYDEHIPVRHTLTELDRKLISTLLLMANDEFANHGCNDFDLHKHMTPEQAAELQKSVSVWARDAHSGQYSYDWLLMAYFADKVLTTP